MAGTMSQDDLVLDLKASLQDAASVFTQAASGDFKRHLMAAALAFIGKRPRNLVGSITLVADQAQYTAPADFHTFGSSLWGIAPVAKAQPWEKGYPGRLPNVRVIETASTPAVIRSLTLDPPPTGNQIAVLGSEFRFYYYGRHVIDADAAKTTIAAGDRGLLLLRAQAEAMRELAARNITKPVIVREGMGSQARNGTPGYLFQALLEEFEAAA